MAVIQRAILDAQTVPCGPVAVEIPIDIQSSLVSRSVLTEPLAPAPLPKADDAAVERLHQRLKQAKRPLLWLGGGALACGDAVRKLADAGVAVISSTHGRGILPDSHPRSLRAFHNSPSIEAILTQCDLTLVAGSRLRSNETRTWTLPLPRPLVQIDIDPVAANRNYLADEQINGDGAALLAALAARLAPGEKVNAEWDAEIAGAVQQAESALRQQSGEYAKLNDAIDAALPQDGLLVRDITVSGSVWGSRLFRAISPLCNIHSLAGAIGMGLPMAIGTAIANPQRKVVGLVGDGGLALGLGELATMAQEQVNITPADHERRRLWRDARHSGQVLRRAPVLQRAAYAGVHPDCRSDGAESLEGGRSGTVQRRAGRSDQLPGAVGGRGGHETGRAADFRRAAAENAVLIR